MHFAVANTGKQFDIWPFLKSRVKNENIIYVINSQPPLPQISNRDHSKKNLPLASADYIICERLYINFF